MIGRIRHKRIFTELQTRGRRARKGPVRMIHVPSDDARPLVAFAFGRRFGSAVERNRARRRLRAAFVTSWEAHPGPSGAFLLSGSRSLLSDDFGTLVAAVGHCLGELELSRSLVPEASADEVAR